MPARLSEGQKTLLKMASRILVIMKRKENDEIVISSSGRIGRIVGERMCGKCPEGMTPCYDIEWIEE